jgi:hypothetical protein
MLKPKPRKESFVVSMVCGKLNFSINKTYRINPNSKNSKQELDILAHFFFGADIFKYLRQQCLHSPWNLPEVDD